ncbi:MAG: ABC transporter permease [Bifidobacteriaceae bacterium]|jgi:oligopeptide transport system permease protein|nr:ABC transporter permease [Bifidobacteriaceae bacterium]
MARYIGLRILQTIPVIIGTTFLIYALVFAMPGDPVRAMFGNHPPSEAAMAVIRHEFHLDEPFIMQYLHFLYGALTFDFGKTFQGRAVSDVIATSLPITAQLAFLAIFFEILIGVGLGIIVGVKKGKIFDNFILMSTLVIISIPTFVLGFVCQFLFGVKMRILPTTVGNYVDLYHMLMPALILAGVSVSYVIRLTRSQVRDNMNADYVRTARAKGLDNKTVILKHVLRNSLLPVITYIGADLGALMGGAVVTEAVFNINGIGHQLYSAIAKGEGTLVVSLVTVLVMIYIIANLIVDVLYAVLDPRIRYGKS